MIPKGNIAILATLDTKGAEVASMRGLLETLGYAATVIDIGAAGSARDPARTSRTTRWPARADGSSRTWSGRASGIGSWK